MFQRTIHIKPLLAGGVVAGPLFVAAVLIQASTRDGFDLGRHPLSLLSLGDLGWIQIATFVITGTLYLACATGLRRALRPGRGGTWGPVLVGTAGVGLIAAGVFVTDAGAGFPPGAPDGAPAQISWHGALHEVGFLLAFGGLVAGCLVLARRFAVDRQRGWAWTGVAAALATVAVAVWPDLNSISVRLLVASAILFAFVAAAATGLIVRAPGSDQPGELHQPRRRPGAREVDPQPELTS